MICRILNFVLSISIIIALSILIGNNPKNIRIRFIIQIFIVELCFGYYMLHSQIGSGAMQGICSLFNALLSFSEKGTNFVFGGMHEQGLAIFFLHVLCPIIFISALIGVLHYTRILHFSIQIIGTILSKINGMGKLESFNAVSSLILGQSENFIIYKDIIGKISEPRIYSMATTAMSTVSLSVISAYMTILNPKYVITALGLNMFSTFIVLSLLNPYMVDTTQDTYLPNFYIKNKNFFEVIGEYILIGFKITITVSAMLIGFIALLEALNAIFKVLFHFSLQEILSYILFPFAWIIMGIPANESLQASTVMAIKLVSNEFIAMEYLQTHCDSLSPQSIGVLSIFLVSFSNLSSIGIIIGSIKRLNEKQGAIISRYSIKIIYSSTLINMLSASIARLVL